MKKPGRQKTAIFRADSSEKIGAGHIFRCLPLADEFEKSNTDVHFITKRLKGHSGDVIEQKGYQVHYIENNYEGNDRFEWDHDIIRSGEIIKKINQFSDWIIIDHYQIEKKWENRIKDHAKKILVVDDLANREHECNILLDQTFGREKNDYAGFTGNECELLLGPEYALLRKEFSIIRNQSLERRKKISQPKKILISMGGTDILNTSGIIIDGIRELYAHMEIEVVLGAKSPHIEKVKAKARESDMNIRVSVGVTNMAEIMSQSDIAIGAGGITSWERCCLGLPSLIIIAAENQKKIAENLDRYGAAKIIGHVTEFKTDNMKHELQHLVSNRKEYLLMSQKSSAICDGRGAARVFKEMAKYE